MATSMRPLAAATYSAFPPPRSDRSSIKLPPKSTKSRGSCRQCRSRRIKCDQERPACRACSAKGLVCPGYVRELQWSAKHDRQSFTESSSRKRRKLRAEAIGQGVTTPVSVAKPGGEFQALADDSQSLHLCDSGGYQQVAAQAAATDPAFSASESVQCPDSGHDVDPGDDAWIASQSPFQQTIFPDLPSGNFAIVANDAQINPDEDNPETIDEYVIRSDSRVYTTDAVSYNSNSSNPANLLHWFYRSKPSEYSDTDLVEHYFLNVCRLYSLFDSFKNPFRALVGSNWDNSGSVSLAIQSMACAHLSNTNISMIQVGRHKQQQARTSILNDLVLCRSGFISSDRVLLAILLLGPTVSWHKTGDLGLEYLHIARELVDARLNQPQHLGGGSNQLEHFFLNSMIYWEMMVAFVGGSDGQPERIRNDFEHDLSAISGRGAAHQSIKPHPWTGVAPHVTTLFAEVGRILRRRIRDEKLPDPGEVRWASSVEEALVDAYLPSHDAIIGQDDDNTPKDHFIQLAEAYRCAGLLLIYHVFPTVLLERLVASDISLPQDHPAHPDACRRYRTTLALRILAIVESLPLWSGTSCLHPILVLCAGSELRLTSPVLTEEMDDNQPQAVQIAAARAFAGQRLSDLARRLPQKPFLRMLDIMKETWLQMDIFGMDVHWMQVMFEKGWETIMG